MILAVTHGMGARGEGKVVTAVLNPLPHTYTRERSGARNPKS